MGDASRDPPAGAYRFVLATIAILTMAIAAFWVVVFPDGKAARSATRAGVVPGGRQTEIPRAAGRANRNPNTVDLDALRSEKVLT